MGNAEYMGVQVSTIMRSLILLALSGLLHGEVVVKQLHIHEGGTNYNQTITLDFDRNIQILEVPAHNQIVHSKTIFDFSQGVMIESHPEAKLCYMKDIPVGIVSMEKFGTFLDDNKGTIKAAKEVTTRRAYKTVSKVTHQQFSALATAAVTECVGYTTYLVQPVQVEEIEISYQRAPISFGKPANMQAIPVGGRLIVRIPQMSSVVDIWSTAKSFTIVQMMSVILLVRLALTFNALNVLMLGRSVTQYSIKVKCLLVQRIQNLERIAAKFSAPWLMTYLMVIGVVIPLMRNSRWVTLVCCFVPAWCMGAQLLVKTMATGALRTILIKM